MGAARDVASSGGPHDPPGAVGVLNSVAPPPTLPPPPAPLVPVGGRLANFASQWREITDDKYVLSVISQGYAIPFDSPPPMTRKPVFFSVRDESHVSLLLAEIDSLLEKRAVERVENHQSPGYYSRLFLVKKKNGKLRPVIDLSQLNKHIKLDHFKMETQESVRTTVRDHFWTVSIDLQDAYLHVPVRPTYRKYLRFAFCGQVFQFRSLPFGICTAPCLFTRLMKCVAGFIRRQGPSLMQYLDDWLVYSLSREVLLNHLTQVWGIITNLGLIPNLEKSELVPAQRFQYIGMYFLTDLGIVRIPSDRVDSLVTQLSRCIQSSRLSARTFLSLLGSLNAAAPFVELGRLHLRQLQFILFSLWRPHALPLDYEIGLDQTRFKHHLRWWLEPGRLTRGVTMHSPTATVHLYTDASRHGWGAHVEPQGSMCKGVWLPAQCQLHINVLELKAVTLAVQALLPLLRGKCVMIATDNRTVVSYIRKEGGTRSYILFTEAWDLLLLCQRNDIMVRVRHIPGRLNVIADSLSRGKTIPTEWSISPEITRALFQLWGTPSVDLFATRFNHKLPQFVSPVPDQGAVGVDALAREWGSQFAYAFPPTKLMPQVLQQVRNSQSRLVLVAPCWPQQLWFNDLLELLMDVPRALPIIPKLLTQNRLSHSNPAMFNLHGWMLSGIQSERESFRNRLPGTSTPLGEIPRTWCTRQDGDASWIGVVRDKSIHSSPLPLI